MKNARTKHLDFIIGDMVALGLARFLMVLMNQDKLNPVLYMYYVQLGLLLVIITLSVAFLTDGYRNILYRGYLKEFIAVIHQMTIIFATEVICNRTAGRRLSWLNTFCPSEWWYISIWSSFCRIFPGKHWSGLAT